VIFYATDGDIKKYLKNGNVTMDAEDDGLYAEDRYSPNQDSIFEDFRGVSLLRTTCLECEQVTQRKETFCDICVPINSMADCGKRK
jgi:ubiquitin carboxyl-terminal hydrolase 1